MSCSVRRRARRRAAFRSSAAWVPPWKRLRSARSPAEVQQVLAASRWGDPGAETPAAVGLGMRMA